MDQSCNHVLLGFILGMIVCAIIVVAAGAAFRVF